MTNGLMRLTGKVWKHPANRGRRIQRLARAVMFQVRGRVLRRPTVVTVGEHSRMLASLDSSASILAAYAPVPDFAEWQVWKRYLSPGDVFVDVGANIGTYSVLAAELGARVIAVEPDPDNQRRLRANLDLNGYDAEIWGLALTDEPKVLQFSDDLDSMNHITSGPGRSVRGEPYDALIETRRVRGMKVDVEGAERQVLAGATQALRDGRIDLLQLEWNECARTNFGESREALAEVLREHDYQLCRPDAEGRLHPTDGAEGSDVFAVRPDVGLV